MCVKDGARVPWQGKQVQGEALFVSSCQTLAGFCAGSLPWRGALRSVYLACPMCSAGSGA